ncbi:FxLYD domain-containing protein [Natrialbaceae archaeon A-gly3]
MDRRTFLRRSAVPLVAIGAGCVSSGQDQTEATADALDVLEEELVHTGEGEETGVKVRALVENVTSEPLGQVAASATFIEDETLLGSWVVTTNGMDPGQRWEFDVRSGGTTGEDAQAVDDVQLDVEERVPAGDYGSNVIEILEDELVHDEDDVVVEGTARNAGDDRLEHATIVATFADGDDVLVGQALTHTVRDVDPEQRFEFSIRYSDRVREPTDVEGYQLTARDRAEEPSN